MKKLLLSAVAVLMFAVAANAQEQGQIRLNAGLALGTKAAIDDDGSEKLGAGINIGGEYLITDVISIAPSYTFFFKSEVGTDPNTISVNYSSINIDGRYYFVTDNVEVYALAGLSFATGTVEFSNAFFGGTFEEDVSETGLNIGAGINLPLGDAFGVNGQLKYNTPIEQLVIGAGVYFSLN